MFRTVLFGILSVVVLFGNSRAAHAQVGKHTHMHHSLHELKQSREELKEAAHNFGGHREAALRDVNLAIEQLELALKSVKK